MIEEDDIIFSIHFFDNHWQMKTFHDQMIFYHVCDNRSYNTSKTTECRAKTDDEGSALRREQFGCEGANGVESHRSEKLTEKKTNHLKSRCI